MRLGQQYILNVKTRSFTFLETMCKESHFRRSRSHRLFFPRCPTDKEGATLFESLKGSSSEHDHPGGSFYTKDTSRHTLRHSGSKNRCMLCLYTFFQLCSASPTHWCTLRPAGSPMVCRCSHYSTLVGAQRAGYIHSVPVQLALGLSAATSSADNVFIVRDRVDGCAG